MARVRIADRASPPTTTEPSPRYSSEPAPGISTRGNMPKTLVSVDMKMGRMRLRVASMMASETAMPSLRMWNNVWCTSRMALLTTMPIRMTNPSRVSMSNGWKV